jgi:hypothetical protein
VSPRAGLDDFEERKIACRCRDTISRSPRRLPGHHMGLCCPDSSLLRPLLPTRCRCRELLSRLITLGRTPLDEGSGCQRDLSPPYNTTFTKDRYPCPRRDSNLQSSKRAAADTRHRPRGHWDRRAIYVTRIYVYAVQEAYCIMFGALTRAHGFLYIG